MSRAVYLTIIGVCLLGAASVPIIIEDWRAEENRANAEAERRAREMPAPLEWPTPPPIPRAKWSADGFSYPAVDPEFDPCGSGPMRPVSSNEEAS